MTNRIFEVRETGWWLIGLFLAVQTALIVVLVVHGPAVFVPVARWSGWALHPDLLFAAALFLVGLVGVVFLLGRLRPVDVGIRLRQVLPALMVTAVLWALTQLVLVAAAVAGGDGLALHAGWRTPGVVPTLGFTVAMLVGMAVYEEVAFRGYLFPQLYLKFRGTAGVRIALAAVVSSLLFALVHIPTRLLNAQVPVEALLPQMAVLTAAGLFGAALYLRTRNLFVVVGVHALVNAPTPLVASPLSPFGVTVALSVALWIVWPWLARRGSARSAGRALPGEAG